MFKLFSCVLACVFFALGATCVAHAYEVTYDCGDYSDGVSVPPDPEAVSANASFKPAANTCVSSMPNYAQFVGWAVSKTTDIKPSGQAFNWNYDEDKTFTAIWSCWPNEDDTDCLPGYEIVFALRPVDSTWNPPVPDKIYTIYGVGAYLDAERTQKMEVGDGSYRIIPPTKPALIVTLHTNGPNNPVFLPDEVSRTTTPASYEPQNVQSSFTRFEYGPLSPTVSYGSNGISYWRTDSNGYLTADGEQFAKTATGDGVWYAKWSGYPSELRPTLAGYTFDGWYDNPAGTGESIAYNTENNTVFDLYARWTPNTYTINYDLGDFGEWEENAVHEEHASYDTPFKVNHPVSTRVGYVFDGWDVTNLTESGSVVHYYSANPIIVENTYQDGTSTISGWRLPKTSATWFMNLRSTGGEVKFTPQWACDTKNGYRLVEGECSNEYTVSYSVTNVPSTVTVPGSDVVTAGTQGYSLENIPTPTASYTCTSWSCTDSTDQPVTVTNNTIDMPTADVTCSSTCSCNNGFYWDASNNVCEPGYEITISSYPGTSWDVAPVPDKLYTIKNVGVYLDSARTQKMTTDGQYHISPPSITPGIVTRDTNAPFNPVTGSRYATRPASFPQITLERNFAGIGVNNYGQVSDTYIGTNGYITSYGISAGTAMIGNATWYAWWGAMTSTLGVPVLDGYTFEGWYDGSDNEWQDVSTSDGISQLTLYAHWTPKTYNIQYELGNNASFESGAVHPTSADYDTEFSVSIPSTSTGYRFTGWNITNMDTGTHYYSDSAIISNNVYQQQGTTTSQSTSLSGITGTHFMNLQSTSDATVVFTAQIECDEGYEYVNGECKKIVSLTYVVTPAVIPQGANITVPINNPVTVTAGTTYYQLEDKPSGTGYTCTKWSCEYANNQSLTVNDSNQLLFIPASNITCTSTCTANNINLIWNPNGGTMDNDNPDSCTYWDEDGISTVYQPNKPGYSFLGWLITGWTDVLLRLQNVNSPGTDYASTELVGGSCGGYSIQQPQTPNLYGLLNEYCPWSAAKAGTWGVGFDYGIVRGKAVCAINSVIQYETGTPDTDNNNGQYCWCRLTSYTTADLSVTETYDDAPWVYLGIPNGNSSCKQQCSWACMETVHNSATFRSALYNQMQ